MIITTLSLLILATTTQPVVSQWPGSGPDVCVVPSTFPVRPETTCSDSLSSRSDCQALNIDLAFQRGETEDVQILIRKESDLDDVKGGVENVSVALTQVSDPSVNIAFQRVLYVKADRTPRYPGSGGGWRADPLYPIPANTTFDVPSGVTQSIWVSFTVSEEAIPGHNVTGEISLSTNKTVFKIPFNLQVSNVTLPSLSDSKIGTAWSGSWTSSTFEPYYNSFDWNKSKNEWYDIMLNSRMPPDSIYINKPRPFDDYVYLDKNGVQSFALLDVCSLPLGDDDDDVVVRAHGRRLGSCANYTDSYVNRLIETLDPIVQELRSKDMLKHAYIYGFDENPVSCEPQVRKLFGATKKAFPDLRT